MNITEIILEEVAVSGMTPMQICEAPPIVGNGEFAPNYFFADRVVARMGGLSFTTFNTTGENLGEHLRQSGQKHDIKAPRYCFIIHEGRAYDAATPHGVDTWDQLPYFRARGFRAVNYIMEYGKIIPEP